MKKVRANKPTRNQRKIEEPSTLGKEIDQLATVFLDVGEELESVLSESSPLEDIEGAKTQAAEALDRYTSLMKKLGKQKRGEIQQMFKPSIAHIKNSLTRLKEAPE